jgi:hypothetical protein
LQHFAAEEAGWDYKIIKAFDINTTANEVILILKLPLKHMGSITYIRQIWVQVYAFNHGKSVIAQVSTCGLQAPYNTLN